MNHFFVIAKSESEKSSGCASVGRRSMERPKRCLSTPLPDAAAPLSLECTPAAERSASASFSASRAEGAAPVAASTNALLAAVTERTVSVLPWAKVRICAGS